MGVYRIKLAGRKKPVLLRAKSKTEAIERVVDEVKSLTGDEVEALLESGERVWKDGEEFPADEPGDGEDGLLKDGKIDPLGALRKAPTETDLNAGAE